MEKTITSFAKMKGRSYGFDDQADNSYEQLDIEVNDWKPHKSAAKAVIFSDPGRNPRFPEIADRNDHNLILDPKDDVIRDRLVFGVEMSKQVGRLEIGKDQESFDVDAARLIESERDQNVAQVYQKKIPTVNMAKDRGREGVDSEKEDYPLELDVKVDPVKGGVRSYVSMAKQLPREDGQGMSPQYEELDLAPNYDASSK